MRIHCFRHLLTFVLALCAQRASAFLDPPYITPQNPTAGDTVSVNVYGGECDVLSIGIVPPVVEQQGSEITILFTGIHEGDPEWCYFGIGTASYPVGNYSPGSYTLDVERRYGNPFGSWSQETLGIIPFTVSGVPPQQPIEAPTLSMAGFGGLLLALIAVALLALRRKA
jgi:hypothetical protein